MDLAKSLVNTSSEVSTTFDNTTTKNNGVLNTSVPVGCIEVTFTELEFLPWDNPDNIISLEVEAIFRRVKDNLLVLLFLIGGPGNVINMAVFYKQGIKDRVNLCLFALSLADELFLTYAMFIHGEQVHVQFTTKEVYGPLTTFFANNNLVGFFGFKWVSQVLSTIIATERCLCILNPLKFQTLLQTRTMAVIITTVFVLIVGFYFIVSQRYKIGCVYDSVAGRAYKELIIGDFYRNHKELINYLDSFVYGAAIPGLSIVVVMIATVITTVKLRQILKWRADTSSFISARESSLTKMLIGSSVLFIACITPVGLFRVVCVFFPDINIGARHQNFYMGCLWILQIPSFINSTFNIFVYYTMGSRYRETFWSLFNKVSSSKLERIV